MATTSTAKSGETRVATTGKVRTERDSMGPMEMPADALYGASTMRTVLNFPTTDLRPPELAQVDADNRVVRFYGWGVCERSSNRNPGKFIGGRSGFNINGLNGEIPVIIPARSVHWQGGMGQRLKPDTGDLPARRNF